MYACRRVSVPCRLRVTVVCVCVCVCVLMGVSVLESVSACLRAMGSRRIADAALTELSITDRTVDDRY